MSGIILSGKPPGKSSILFGAEQMKILQRIFKANYHGSMSYNKI